MARANPRRHRREIALSLAQYRYDAGMAEPERLPPPPFWRTRYFALTVMAKADRRWIDPTDILRALNQPSRRDRQSDGRYRYWAYVPRLGTYIRVVTLSDGETVHNVFKDRDFTG